MKKWMLLVAGVCLALTGCRQKEPPQGTKEETPATRQRASVTDHVRRPSTGQSPQGVAIGATDANDDIPGTNEVQAHTQEASDETKTAKLHRLPQLLYAMNSDDEATDSLWEKVKREDKALGYWEFLRRNDCSKYSVAARSRLWELIQQRQLLVKVTASLEGGDWRWKDAKELADYLSSRLATIGAKVAADTDAACDASLDVGLRQETLARYTVQQGNSSSYIGPKEFLSKAYYSHVHVLRPRESRFLVFAVDRRDKPDLLPSYGEFTQRGLFYETKEGPLALSNPSFSRNSRGPVSQISNIRLGSPVPTGEPRIPQDAVLISPYCTCLAAAFSPVEYSRFDERLVIREGTIRAMDDADDRLEQMACFSLKDLGGDALTAIPSLVNIWEKKRHTGTGRDALIVLLEITEGHLLGRSANDQEVRDVLEVVRGILGPPYSTTPVK